VFLFILMVVIIGLLGRQAVNESGQNQLLGNVIEMVAWLIGLSYVPVCWYLFGGTIGQRYLKLRIVRDSDGENLSLARILLRYVIWLVCLGPIVPAIVMALATRSSPSRRTWVDVAGGSVVVRSYPLDGPNVFFSVERSRTILDFEVRASTIQSIDRWARDLGFGLDEVGADGTRHYTKGMAYQNGYTVFAHLDLLIKDERAHVEAWLTFDRFTRMIYFGSLKELALGSGVPGDLLNQPSARRKINQLLRAMGGPTID